MAYKRMLAYDKTSNQKRTEVSENVSFFSPVWSIAGIAEESKAVRSDATSTSMVSIA